MTSKEQAEQLARKCAEDYWESDDPSEVCVDDLTVSLQRTIPLVELIEVARAAAIHRTDLEIGLCNALAALRKKIEL